MPGYLLTTATVATCPHGGSASFTASQDRVLADGAPVLVLSDSTTITGCPFMVGNVASPCTTVRWQSPAVRVTAGDPVLLDTSVGLCLSAASAPQGTLQIRTNQSKVEGR
ncbi:hypothetical protein ACN26Y_18585 [Micromonospora sp. WMMD558]|uniref:hypothetical protein n=1 Tax=unclassified Micromonospora TaxID=2617518 RepID=UPI001E2A24B9|nr:hypothetical protein [Micromonospora sp. WMMC415]